MLLIPAVSMIKLAFTFIFASSILSTSRARSLQLQLEIARIFSSASWVSSAIWSAIFASAFLMPLA